MNFSFLGHRAAQATRVLHIANCSSFNSHNHRLHWSAPSTRGSRLVCGSTAQQAPALPKSPGLQNRKWNETSEELQALSALEQRLKTQRVNPLPDRQTQIWFLRDRSLDVAEAVEKLTAMLHWRERCRPQDLTAEQVAAEAATGKVVLHAHPDNFGRPVVLVRAARHIRGEWPQEDSQRLCAYIIETAVNKLPQDGESILGIFDLQGFGPSNADLEFFFFLIDVFFQYYPKRLSQLLLVDAPWVFRPLWAAVKPAMGKYSQLATFTSKDKLCPMYFDQQTLPDSLRG